METLRIGEHVVTHGGLMRPIKWVGRRCYAGRFVADNPGVLPVLILAGALADGLPRGDLAVSPEHAMFVDGMLIPAGLLVNGVSILQRDRVDVVEYFHVELDTHDVILAEGAPAESFADDFSRGMFANAVEYGVLYPGEMRGGAAVLRASGGGWGRVGGSAEAACGPSQAPRRVGKAPPGRTRWGFRRS